MNERRVENYGLLEYGIEWGYETDEDGNSKIYVADASTIEYVTSTEEAEQICRSLITQWADNERRIL